MSTDCLKLPSLETPLLVEIDVIEQVGEHAAAWSVVELALHVLLSSHPSQLSHAPAL